MNALKPKVATLESKVATLESRPTAPSPKAYIVESYRNGNNWYRKYSDGWIEQGGYITVSHKSDYTFNTPFKTTNHTLVGSVNSSYPLVVNRNTTTKFTMYLYQDSGSTGYASWYACGY